ncbi:MAG: twin-arginine translocase subunit TatC [Actinobacteria bacterium]|nr:twin-arginine translocase subunit TatC [Actinomycetota bacterium]MSX87709.1 twin-arginine translocase subunit TatC [Actinomycetota bacterium]MSY71063.1 twin-arginine translocase subunit TatC [Actinomycetota bacterium]
MAVTHVEEGRMTLVQHLVELRNRLIKSVLAVALGAIVCFVFYSPIFRALVRPYCESLSDAAKARSALLTGDASTSCKLIARDPLEGFGVRMSVAAYGGISLAMPVILWQLWRFIAPGLYKHERKYARGFVVSGVLLFLLGGGLAYWSIPHALEFLNAIGGDDLAVAYSPGPYLSFIVKMIVAFGIGFEFPILLCFLQLIGVVTPQQLRKFWRHSLVGIVILVAVVTPSGDPITLTVMSVPMYIFYELSIFFGRMQQRRKRKAAERTSDVAA